MDQKVKRSRPKAKPGVTEPAIKKIKLIYPYHLPPELWRMIVVYLTTVRDRVHAMLTNHTHHLAVQTDDLHEKMKRIAFRDLIWNHKLLEGQWKLSGGESDLYDTMGKPPNAIQADLLNSIIRRRRHAVRHAMYVQSHGDGPGYNLYVDDSDILKYTTPREPKIINISGSSSIYNYANTDKAEWDKFIWKGFIIICHGINPERIVMKCKTPSESSEVFDEFFMYLKNLCLGLGMIFNPPDFKYHFEWKQKPPIMPVCLDGDEEPCMKYPGFECGCSECIPKRKVLTYG